MLHTSTCLRDCHQRCTDAEVDSFSNYGMKSYHEGVKFLLQNTNSNTLFAQSFEHIDDSKLYIQNTYERMQNSDISHTDSIMLLPPLFGIPSTPGEYLLQMGEHIILVIYNTGVIIPVICNPTVNALNTDLHLILKLYDGNSLHF